MLEISTIFENITFFENFNNFGKFKKHKFALISEMVRDRKKQNYFFGLHALSMITASMTYLNILKCKYFMHHFDAIITLCTLQII